MIEDCINASKASREMLSYNIHLFGGVYNGNFFRDK